MSIKVYKASAGSGKTYTLVYEYIKYLFLAQIGSQSAQKSDVVLKTTLNLHRGILAMTFTNKSTAEMKERIVKSLYEMSRGEKRDYVEKLRGDIPSLANVGDTEIGLYAERFLSDILQDYNNFRVSTIDGFFQQVVRSFARELNLNNQYQVELETDKILELAVDNMFSTLGDEGKEQLLDWLTMFSSERVNNDKSWNPRGAILNLSKLIMTEDYMSQKEKLEAKGESESLGQDFVVLKKYKNHLDDIIKRFESDVKSACDKAQEVMGRVNVADVLVKNQISCFNYEYLRGKGYEVTTSFKKGKDSADLSLWCKGKYKKDTSLQEVADELHECAKIVVDLCDVEEERFKEYQTARIVKERLYILGILSEIDGHVMEICRDRDCLVISSTADFINRIIDNSDTPFIYEKVGVRTEHFMVDEFQDTSRMQWSNLVPLLQETVSQGKESLIVGDVKQSIYRWRNGDWKILHEGVEKKFSGYTEQKPLSSNYRSSAEIIQFNNKLYEELPKLVDAQLGKQGVVDGDYLQKMYVDSDQKVGGKDKPKGYVRVEFFENDKEGGKDWTEVSMDKMVEQMRVLKAYGEMAVLVRVNKEAKLVAERLKIEGIPFYSSEALCVADNRAVKFIEAILRYFMQPHEQLYRANMLALYREVCCDKVVGVEDSELLSYRGINYREWEMKLFEDEEFVSRFTQIKYQSLIQTIESLIALFELDSINNGVHGIYLQSFLDKVQNYAVDGALDINSLLEYWGMQGEKTFIAMPEGGDAVRIITIHKSKGLEFGVVFIPFMDWCLGLSGLSDIQLVNVENKKKISHVFIEDVPLVPIDMQSSKKLKNSKFYDDVVGEYLAMCLDVMNVLYVATTRASQQLYLHCKEFVESKSSGKESKTDKIPVSALLYDILLGNVDAEKVYEFGEQRAELEIKKLSENVQNIELKRDKEMQPTETEADERAELRFNYSEDECEDDMRRYGIKMHRLFERIVVIEDIDIAIDSLAKEGEDVVGMRSEVDAIMAIDGVRELFDPRWRVMNEAEIFDGARGRVYRPDRVMISELTKEVVVVDYKFGEYTEELHQRYLRQVERYVKLIEEMGYKAKGHILYATSRLLK